jgi:hypothetical protein
LRFRQASFTIVLFFLRKENLATQTGVQSKNDFRPSLRNRLRSARHTLRKSGVTKKKSVHIAKNRFARPAAAAENPVRQRPGEAKILCPPVRGGVRKSFLRLRPALYVDIDCDFYGATLTALRFLFRHGLIVPGTLPSGSGTTTGGRRPAPCIAERSTSGGSRASPRARA